MKALAFALTAMMIGCREDPPSPTIPMPPPETPRSEPRKPADAQMPPAEEDTPENAMARLIKRRDDHERRFAEAWCSVLLDVEKLGDFCRSDRLRKERQKEDIALRAYRAWRKDFRPPEPREAIQIEGSQADAGRLRMVKEGEVWKVDRE